MNDAQPVQIRFPLDSDDWHGYGNETVWAESSDGVSFRVRNTPFFVKDVSFDDVISARLSLDGYDFDGVVERGGHSTYRIIPTESDDAKVEGGLETLQALGCSWEHGPGGLIALDVPPSSDIDHVYAALVAGVTGGTWDFEEGHVGHRIVGEGRTVVDGAPGSRSA